jgi:hypothetical protein
MHCCPQVLARLLPLVFDPATEGAEALRQALSVGLEAFAGVGPAATRALVGDKIESASMRKARLQNEAAGPRCIGMPACVSACQLLPVYMRTSACTASATRQAPQAPTAIG